MVLMRRSFFDKAIFSTFTSSLKAQGYFDGDDNLAIAKVKETESLLRSLISIEVQQTIQGAMAKVAESVENPNIAG